MADVEFIFGGSFDPIHFGHLHIIRSLAKLNPDWPVRVLPCSVPALKRQTNATFEQRVAMIQLALKGFKNFSVDQREVSREGKSYTYDTLLELRAEHLTRHFVLVIGSDNLVSIGQWYRASELAEYCHLIVVNRPESNVERHLGQLQAIGFKPARTISQLEMQPSGLYYHYEIIEKDISSTKIRKSLEQQTEKLQAPGAIDLNKQIQDIKTTTQASQLLEIETPDVVKDYIKHNFIYW